MPRVWAVVLNWNGWRDTIECLESLVPAVVGSLASVVIVDNASPDDSAVRLREWMQSTAGKHGFAFAEFVEQSAARVDCSTEALRFVLIHGAENRGYSVGNNLGLRFIMENCTCDFIWILNNDTIVDDAAIGELVSFADRSSRVGILGSTIVDHNDRNTVQCAGGARYNPWLTISRPALYNFSIDRALSHKRRIRLDYVSGAALFLRADMVREVGLLNPDYFLYFEELDYARRARKAGYEIEWVPASLVYHKGGASAGSRSSRNSKKSVLSEYHSTLSALKYVRAFHPWALPVAFVSRLLLKLLRCALTRDFRLPAAVFRAYRDFVLGGGTR